MIGTKRAPAEPFVTLPSHQITRRLVNLTFTQPRIWNDCPQVFTPVLAKPTKSFNLVATRSVGVGRVPRNFEPTGSRNVVSDIDHRCASETDLLLGIRRWQVQCFEESDGPGEFLTELSD
jgi:hypothetical protein